MLSMKVRSGNSLGIISLCGMCWARKSMVVFNHHIDVYTQIFMGLSMGRWRVSSRSNVGVGTVDVKSPLQLVC